MQSILTLILFFLGACLGSFAGAMVWRLRAQQLADEKKHKQKVDPDEFNRLGPLLEQSWLGGRSIDFDTKRQLAWYEMIPVFSWLALRGKSRYSGKPIGWMEFSLEAGLGLFFAISYLFWPLGSGWLGALVLALWLVAGVLFAVLIAYDGRWSLLPSSVTILLIIVGLLSAAARLIASTSLAQDLVSLLMSVAILSGLYWFLWWVSKERWIGFGDVLLGFGLALLLYRWELALLALFLANFIGLLAVLPSLVAKKLQASSRIPFGPFMIVGAVIAMLFGPAMIESSSLAIDFLAYRLWYN